MHIDHSADAESIWQVAVIGAGAAGLVAAERAASRGLKTLLLEKNRKPGVKILMSGGTRCNLTQATNRRGIVAAYGPPGRFLHSALAALGPQELVALVEGEGVPTKIEETGKIFPVSNKAADVLMAFMNRLQRSGCELALEEALIEIQTLGELQDRTGGFQLVTTKRTLTAKKLIVTTGGQSYPGSGTTGDGYHWAQQRGHTIVPPRPALVPITTSAAWVRELSGITIPDVVLRLVELDTENSTGSASGGWGRPKGAPSGQNAGGSAALDPSHPLISISSTKEKILDTRRGSLLFAHFGLSGPVVLDISRHVSGHLQPQLLTLLCDFLPNEKHSELDKRLHNQAAAEGKKQLASLIPEILPRRLAEVLLHEAGLSVDKKAGELSNANRAALVRVLKELPIPVTGTRGFAKAEVTAGGISLAEVDSSSMQSKLVRGLYLAGEVLDLDGPIGGYNFQAAFSTGWLAGSSV